MRSRSILIGLAAFATFTLFQSTLHAQSRPPQVGGNAALRYWQAFAHLPKFDEQQQKLLAAAPWPGGIDPEAVKLVESGKDALLYLRRGAAIPHCDWGLYPEDGPYLLLPHLSRGRDLARLATAKARHDFALGNTREAVDGAVDVIWLGRHLSADLTAIISYLVQLGVERMAIETLAPHLAGLDAATLDHLDRRLSALWPGGSMERCMRVERESFLEWAIGHLGHMKDNDPWKEKVLGPFGGGTEHDPATVDKVVAAAGGTRQGVLKQFEALRQYYQELEAILPLPRDQFMAKLADLEKRAKENPVASVTLPSVAKVYDRDAAGRTRMTLLKAAIAVARGGPERAKDFKDASGAPVEYMATESGFELRSKVVDDGQAVLLKVGGKQGQ